LLGVAAAFSNTTAMSSGLQGLVGKNMFEVLWVIFWTSHNYWMWNPLTFQRGSSRLEYISNLP